MNGRAADGASDARGSPWSPLRLPLFRTIWIATIASNIGTWMHEVGAGWLMTSLSAEPVMIALVQTATTLPILLLALPAGALADIVDRRRYLLGVQVWLAVTAGLLGALTLAGLTTAWMLVALTFAMGIGTAMMMPAWAAVTPEIVPRAELSNAVALNSLGMNVARAIGPAIAGVVVSTLGTGAVFVLNALSFLGVMGALLVWRREPVATTLPAERFFSALRTGFRFARFHAPLQAAVIRGVGFFVFASAPWALLPLLARALPGAGAATFGLLVAAVGAGAVLGALVLPALRAQFGRDTLVAGATALYAVAMLLLAWLTSVPLLLVAMAGSGLAWIAVLSSLQVAAQLALPGWVRSRGLAVFMAAFMGSMAFGSLLWGAVAQAAGIGIALAIAAAGALLAIPITRGFRIGSVEDLRLEPSMHWPTPLVHDSVTGERGPVMVTVTYPVDASHRDEFLRVVQRLGRSRRRDGAFAWGVLEDSERPNRFLEFFMVDSWLEHLRQHERVTHGDQLLQEALRRMMEPGGEPQVAHFVAAESVFRTPNP